MTSRPPMASQLPSFSCLCPDSVETGENDLPAYCLKTTNKRRDWHSGSQILPRGTWHGALTMPTLGNWAWTHGRKLQLASSSRTWGMAVQGLVLYGWEGLRCTAASSTPTAPILLWAALLVVQTVSNPRQKTWCRYDFLKNPRLNLLLFWWKVVNY